MACPYLWTSIGCQNHPRFRSRSGLGVLHVWRLGTDSFTVFANRQDMHRNWGLIITDRRVNWELTIWDRHINCGDSNMFNAYQKGTQNEDNAFIFYFN